MRKRAIILAATMSLTGLFASAREMKLLINGEDVFKVPASITFDGDNAVLHFADGDEAYDMETVAMHFTTVSGIDEIESMAFRGIVDNTLVVDVPTEGAIVEVYDVSGMRRALAEAVGTRAEIDLSACAPGVYLLKVGNACVKFVKR